MGWKISKGGGPVEPVEFSVLGPVRVQRAGEEVALGSLQERALLALLLVRAGQPVAVSEIVTVMWGARPPDSAVNVVRRHVGSLRRLMEPGLPVRAVGRWMARDAGGYLWTADADSLDLLRFRRLRDEARRAEPGQAVGLLVEALSSWRGPVAGDIAAEVRERAGFGAVDRERQAAVREAADAALRAGVPVVVLPLLRQAAADDPLDEPVLARLILVLAAMGHRCEAADTYRTAATRLAHELGIDPGAELREAHRASLTDATPPASLPRPAQRPHDLSTFTGRESELDDVLAGSDPTGEWSSRRSAGWPALGRRPLPCTWRIGSPSGSPTGSSTSICAASTRPVP
ncbi:BTAD domain-containing putative transcriptional regulator [Streptomyces sp. NPDC086033]|uniref:AfsR/SARP family transcriptional regulator n=1 Tax=Streptomyces sp. NPDC086033 TaxID=3365747 RepID=UPI0037D139B5